MRIFLQTLESGALLARARADGDGIIGDAMWDLPVGQALYGVSYDELEAAAPCELDVDEQGRGEIVSRN